MFIKFTSHRKSVKGLTEFNYYKKIEKYQTEFQFMKWKFYELKWKNTKNSR